MTMLNIRILRVGDPAPFATSDPVEEAQIVEILGLERGTENGQPSVALVAKTFDGRLIFAETTVALLATAMAALHGAFPESFHDGGAACP